ncbi:MAG: DUF2958 domain-containing protein [Bdellovibrionales bacterium]|nr:DUF2958 domain-containing protein [Bdellovibrionales bacterium]
MTSKLKQNLLHKINRQDVPKIYETENVAIEQKKLLFKFFTPDSHWTWYAWEAEKIGDEDIKFFGPVDGDFLEMGYFYLSELDRICGGLGLPVEIDQYPNETEYQKMLRRLMKIEV